MRKDYGFHLTGECSSWQMAQRQFMLGHKLATSTLSSFTCSLKVNIGKHEFLCCWGVAGPGRIFLGSVASEDSCGHALTI